MADSYIDFGVDVGGVAVDLSPAEQGGLFTSLVIDYSSTSHLGVTITNGTTLVKTVLTSEQFAIETSPSLQIQLDFDEIDEYSSLLATDMVRITRLTPTSELERTFVDGSVLKASDINTQNKQLLYGIQERGSGDIKIDTDGKLDAAANTGGVAAVIKNVITGGNENEVVTRGYVDNLSLYGIVFGATDPQFWSFTTASGDVSGTNRVFTLDEPTPSSESDNMYLVEVGGVLQSPNDYTVTSAGTVYSLTFANAAPEQSQEIAKDVGIAVRNFGVSRNVVVQPYVNLNESTVALTVRRLSSGTSANLQEWQDDAGTPLAYVDPLGGLRVGATGTPDDDSIVMTPGTVPTLEVGKYDAIVGATTAGVDIRNLGSYGAIRISAKAGVTQNVLYVIRDGDDKVRIDAAGNVNCSTLDVQGTIRLYGGSGASKGIRPRVTDTEPGVIYFGTDGPVIQNDSTHYIQSQSDKVLVVGNLETSAGDLTVDGDITTSGDIKMAGAGEIVNTTYSDGAFYINSGGPVIQYDSTHYAHQTSGKLAVTGPLWMQTDQIDMKGDGSNKKIINLAEPEASDDAATMNYVDTAVDTAVAAAGPSVTGGWQYLQAPAYNATAVDNITFAADGTGAGQIDYSKYSAFRVQWHKGDTQYHRRNVYIQFKVGSTWTMFASPEFPVQSSDYGSSGWLEVWNVDTTDDDARWFGNYQFRAHGTSGDTVTDRVWDPGGYSVTGFRIQSIDGKKVRGVFQLFGFYTGTPLI